MSYRRKEGGPKAVRPASNPAGVSHISPVVATLRRSTSLPCVNRPAEFRNPEAVASSRFTHHATPKGSYLAFVREPTTSFSASRDARKMRQRTCEVIPVFQDIEFNRHLQAVLHELDVALQRRYAHFERTR